MKIILLERIEKLGQMGEVVSVKPGYARNFLLPQKKALRASKENIAYFEGKKSDIEAVNLKRRQEAEAAAKKMENTKVNLTRQASENGQLYGSIRPVDIVEGLAEKLIRVSRSQVDIATPIKTAGIHEVRVVLHPEVSIMISVNIAPTKEAAEQFERELMKSSAQAPDMAAESFENAEAEASAAPKEKPSKKAKTAEIETATEAQEEA